MRYFPVVALLLLAACGEQLTPQEQAARDERDIAMVEKANLGTAVPIAPQPILFPDIQANKLFGMGCAFVAKSAGLGAIMIARADDGFMKLDDQIIRFAADKGSSELPYGARERYAGKKYAFQLAVASEKSLRSGTETADYSGRLSVQDGKGHIVYDEPGTVQCGS